MPATQITGQIPAGIVYGDLSNGYIRGDHLYNDISGVLLTGSVTRATVPAVNISYTNTTGPYKSVFSATIDASGSFTTPVDLSSGCVYSLFARAADHPAHSIFTTGYIDEGRNWFFAAASNNQTGGDAYTLQPTSDRQKVIITPNPSPLTFTLYYSLVSTVSFLFGTPHP